ncbi:TnsA-like heteromeric transposase endonuclease subunit [Streptomyces sp. SID2955]|nr:TnsA-like heteromeric transposase endonuclease subunit [Streptomyces sp. SID2955]
MSTVEDPGDLLEGEAAPGTEQDVVALYREPYGSVRACGAAGLREVALEEFGPVSDPVPYQGRKGIITYWPVASREQTVVCGSLRQWRLAVELDFEPNWVAFSASPVQLRWRAGGRERRWCPDFVARTLGGVREVLVLKPPGEQSLPAARLQVLEAVARAAGWRVRQVREPSGVRGRNLGWLAGYRFGVGGEDGRGRALLEAFREPTGLRAGVAASGLPALTGLDLAYRMLWQRRLLFDVGQPLLPDALAWTA